MSVQRKPAGTPLTKARKLKRRRIVTILALAFGLAAAPEPSAAPIPATTPIDALGARFVLLGPDIPLLEDLPGYSELLRRKAANPPEIAVGKPLPRMLDVQPQIEPQPQQASASPETEAEGAPSAPSLRNVLRVSPARGRARSAGDFGDDGESEEDEYYFDLRKYLLEKENQTLGAFLHKMVEPLRGDEEGLNFSILGLGRWRIEAGDRQIRIIELESGTSSQISAGERLITESKQAQVGGKGTRPEDAPSVKEIIITAILDFVASPLGLFIMIASVWIFLFVAAAKFILVMRPRRY